MTEPATRTASPGLADDARPLVWVPRPVHPDALALLAAHTDLVVGDDVHPFAEVADRVEGIVLRTARVDADMLRAAPHLAIVARHGVGVDTVAVDVAAEFGIAVTTTPAANTVSVAEHAIALLLAVRRGIGAAVRDLGDRGDLVGRELAGSTLGLVGFGRIAQHVARIASAGFGARVLAYDPMIPDADVAALGAEPRTLEALLAESDAVSVHVPLTDATRRLLGAAEFAALPSHAVVLNTSRGGVVDEEALLAALEAGELAGAGLDVTAVEPLAPDHPLRTHPRVVVTPHVGGQTVEAMRRVATDAAESVLTELRRRGRLPA